MIRLYPPIFVTVPEIPPAYFSPPLPSVASVAAFAVVVVAAVTAATLRRLFGWTIFLT